ncbi:hypothetical protein Poly30_25000 [Planctomycetes bacterium Poly30]|uniref:Outer membrane protein beta-barrel domain-containing protein n=2 Tax=Saltatorellus ferox TaxID=2528018 RepID=A0A518ESB2_9BACT|nr:hypothetical protein Poly30_25000 [Planctomycetes bacterium Poly30]
MATAAAVWLLSSCASGPVYTSAPVYPSAPVSSSASGAQRLSVTGQYSRTSRFREVDPSSSPFTVDTLLGIRQLSDENRWQELDSQPEIGVSVQAPILLDDPTTVVDDRTGLWSALSYDFSVRYAFDRSSTTNGGDAVQSLDSRTIDLSAGLILSPFQYKSRFQPYIGGGVAFLFLDTDLRLGNSVQSDRDTVLTSYLRAGALVEFAYGRHVGVDARWLNNADVMIDGLGADVGALTVSLVFGAQF